VKYNTSKKNSRNSSRKERKIPFEKDLGEGGSRARQRKVFLLSARFPDCAMLNRKRNKPIFIGMNEELLVGGEKSV